MFTSLNISFRTKLLVGGYDFYSILPKNHVCWTRVGFLPGYFWVHISILFLWFGIGETHLALMGLWAVEIQCCFFKTMIFLSCVAIFFYQRLTYSVHVVNQQMIWYEVIHLFLLCLANFLFGKKCLVWARCPLFGNLKDVLHVFIFKDSHYLFTYFKTDCWAFARVCNDQGILWFILSVTGHDFAGLFYCWYTRLHCSRGFVEERLWHGMWLVSMSGSLTSIWNILTHGSKLILVSSA